MRRKAISIKQPWAWAILHAGKDVENRTWPFPLPTPCRLVIHAGKRDDPEGREYLDSLSLCGLIGTPPRDLPLGYLVGEVTVTGCREFQPIDVIGGRWSFGPWLWELADPVAYPEPIPCRGQLHIFEVEI